MVSKLFSELASMVLHRPNIYGDRLIADAKEKPKGPGLLQNHRFLRALCFSATRASVPAVVSVGMTRSESGGKRRTMEISFNETERSCRSCVGVMVHVSTKVQLDATKKKFV